MVNGVQVEWPEMLHSFMNRRNLPTFFLLLLFSRPALIRELGVLVAIFYYKPEHLRPSSASHLPHVFSLLGLAVLQRAVLHMADKEYSFAQKPAETLHHLSLSCKVGPVLIDWTVCARVCVFQSWSQERWQFSRVWDDLGCGREKNRGRTSLCCIYCGSNWESIPIRILTVTARNIAWDCS